jgi:SAM-dependent methyltransferase
VCARSTRRFSDRAELYDRFRPGYPSGLIPLLCREIGLAPDWVVADVGAGTGLSSAPFLAHGHPVLAVEPDPAMRRAGRERLSAMPRLEWREGTAEATGLAAASVDLVVAAQAFHWFDASRAGAEFRRILGPGGWIALIWNRRLLDATPFLEGYERLLLRHGTDYDRVRHDRLDASDLAGFFGTSPARHVLRNRQALDREGLEGRLFSSSYLPAPGEPGADELLADLDALFREHERDGRVSLEYETEVYLGPAERRRR